MYRDSTVPIVVCSRGGGYGKAATTIIQGYVCLFVSLAMPQSDSGIFCNLTEWRW